MLVAVAVVLAVAALAFGLLLRRASGRITALEADLTAVRARAEDLDRSLAEARDDVDALTKARDDALEREKRARRDAAEVSKRMQEEAEARVAAEGAHADALEERGRLEAELRTIADSVAEGSPEHVEELWVLALEGVRRTWEISVSPSPGMPNPLDDADDPLRVAVEIEVDAAREDAGALIDLEWEGEAIVAVPVAVRALSLVQAIVARLAKAAEEATVRVEAHEVSVRVSVTATDEGGQSIVPTDIAPELQVEPGVFDIRLSSAASADSA